VSCVVRLINGTTDTFLFGTNILTKYARPLNKHIDSRGKKYSKLHRMNDFVEVFVVIRFNRSAHSVHIASRTVYTWFYLRSPGVLDCVLYAFDNSRCENESGF